MLTDNELQRYHRHLILKGFGTESQHKLKKSRVLVIGAGGLSAPLLLYLAAAGVGKIGIMEDDIVDISNLQRQILYSTESTGKPKGEEAVKKIKALNPLTEISLYPFRCTSGNALETIREYDVVADGSDNFATRYLVNDACVLLGKPLVYGAIHQFEGQVSVFNFPEIDNTFSANYRDIFPEPPAPGSIPDCSEAGVLGVLPGIIGSMQALEVIKVITGTGEPLINRLCIFDALTFQMHTLTIVKDPENPISGENPVIRELQDYELFCNRSAEPSFSFSLSVHRFLEIQKKPESYILIDIREDFERQIDHIGGVHIPQNKAHQIIEAIDKGKICILYCQSGKRSDNAVKKLKEKAPNLPLFSLQGGLNAVREWQKEEKS